MCGIIAILRSVDPARSDVAGLATDAASAFAALQEALGEVVGGALTMERIEELGRHGGALSPLVEALRTPAGVRVVLLDPRLEAALGTWTTECLDGCGRIEELLDASDEAIGGLRGREVERANAVLLDLRDSLWGIGRDALAAVAGVRGLLAGSGVSHLPAVTAALSVHQALSALDRMEVRGRDSAGIHLLCQGHGLDLEGPEWSAVVARRGSPLFEDGGVRVADGTLCLVYKVAREIGELGDNVRALRGALEADVLLAAALRSAEIEVAVLGHTRWASVGLITEANAHPINQECWADDGSRRVGDEPYAVAVLNGDVDNYGDLKARAGLRYPEEITTDAKVIPALFAREMAQGQDPEAAFLRTVAGFVGSVAIGLQAAGDPDRIHLALHGSGQALYVGLAEDAFIVASELYGVVELGPRYVRLDGETPGNPDNPTGSRGQVMTLDRRHAGTIEGIRRRSYDGTELPLSAQEVRRAEITTRDVDRGDHPHYLLKEIGEAPRSFEKTLRGKLRRSGDGWRVVLGPSVIPEAVGERLRSGAIQRILVIGQGTAAVAGRGVAAAISSLLYERLREIRALPATELSGFSLRPDMSDTLVLAISQSGTTTDTNRTVDLVRGRGAAVLAIVNRRNSDLCDKADGVLFTSDGRDIEMSVASTKAFYSQIAAGNLLAVGLAQRVVGADADTEGDVPTLLEALRRLPDAMRRVLELRPEIDEAANRFAPPERYWALVGNGLNRIAAEEIRIKLSELCYKSIACDATEDKKHIDLSSEPLILVCAAGLEGSTAADVAKEVAIYRAHKAVPLVIASEGEERFHAAAALFRVPRVHPSLDFVLSSLVGHLFGYSAALAIDALAEPLHAARSAIEHLAPRWLAEPGQVEILGPLVAETGSALERYLETLSRGRYDGHLEASTATRLTLVTRVVLGQVPLEALPALAGRPASPASLVEELSAALTAAIDELTRPVDAIKHQAKTVTVGISRSDEALLTVPLVAEVLSRGADRDCVSYADLRALAALDPVVERVLGHTRYVVEGDPAAEDCGIRRADAAGVARDLVSRTSQTPVLRGTKRRVALDRKLLVARGSADGRLFLLVPEVRGGRTQGLMLLHIDLVESVAPAVARGVLQGYRGRWEQLRDAVTETEESLRDDLLGDFSMEQLLIEPVANLAAHWRTRGSADPPDAVADRVSGAGDGRTT